MKGWRHRFTPYVNLWEAGPAGTLAAAGSCKNLTGVGQNLRRRWAHAPDRVRAVFFIQGTNRLESVWDHREGWKWLKSVHSGTAVERTRRLDEMVSDLGLTD